jgi:hypothetical protein
MNVDHMLLLIDNHLAEPTACPRIDLIAPRHFLLRRGQGGVWATYVVRAYMFSDRPASKEPEESK